MSNMGSNFPFNNLVSQARQFIRTVGSGGNIPGPPPGYPSAGAPGFVQPGTMQPGNPLALLFANESLRLSPQEVALFLKEALKLPKEIRFLLLEMAFESSPKEVKSALDQTLRQLIEQNTANIPIKDIQELLGKNTKEATEKLMKLLQGNQLISTPSGQQIAEMAATLGKLSEKIKASPLGTMETLMLLYIPWYPLAPQQKLELSFEFGEGEGEDGDKDISMVVYLETNTLGRFKLIVQELNPLQIVVTVSYEAFAKTVIPTIEDQLNEYLAKEGLPAAIFSAEQMQESAQRQTDALIPSQNEDGSFKGITRQANKQQVDVQKGENISLLTLNCAYFLTRLIFELDEQQRVFQKNT